MQDKQKSTTEIENSADTKSLRNGPPNVNGNDVNNSASDSNKNTELINRTQLPGTPFTIVGNDENGYMLTLGKFKLTEILPTQQDVIQKIVEEHWNIILNLITVTHETILAEMTAEENIREWKPEFPPIK